MMDFLGNLCEAMFLIICALGLLEIGKWLRRNIDFNDYDDTE